MATPTLAKSPESHPEFDGSLIENLIREVEEVQKPKPPQPAPIAIPDAVRSDEEKRKANGRLLVELWALGEKMATQAIELPEKPDPLTIALNGFPDVNTYYADQAGR